MTKPQKIPFWRDARQRALFVQIGFLGILAFGLYALISTGLANMAAHGIPVDFRFWSQPAGFDIDQHLIPYSAASSYGRAFLVGLLNTLLVAAIGIVLATVIGFGIGFARASTSIAVARLAQIYVEAIRNVPLLLQLLFWYNVILKTLPVPRRALALPGFIYLTNRGLDIPAPVVKPDFSYVLVAALAGIVGAVLVWRWGKRAMRNKAGATGLARSLLVAVVLLMILVPLVAAYFALGQPLGWVVPKLGRFDFRGGLRLLPEFVALVAGLALYTAAFIAEIVRAGLASVPKGQNEAALALGLSAVQTRTLVVVPQGLRLIVPPLTNEYLNLVKNSSLAVFIGYPDLVQIFDGTVLNQTGAAVPVVMTTMAVYLAISLAMSLVMNIYNRHVLRVGH